jgi:hypothetical protein
MAIAGLQITTLSMSRTITNGVLAIVGECHAKAP